MTVGELKAFLNRFPDDVPVGGACKAIRRENGQYLWVVTASGNFASWSEEGTEPYPIIHFQLLRSSDPEGRVVLTEVLPALREIDPDDRFQ